MRSIKELLILLRDYFPTSDLHDRGFLCAAAYDMHEDHGLITEVELDILRDYIGIHKPIESMSSFFWPEGELAPRMEFLNKLISEL
jgi:hypothetical protein